MEKLKLNYSTDPKSTQAAIKRLTENAELYRKYNLTPDKSFLNQFFKMVKAHLE